MPRILLTGALALLAALPLGAQGVRERVTVTPMLGYINFDRASSLESGAMLGLDGQYRLGRLFSLGTNFSFSRVQTRGEDFLARVTVGNAATGDTSYFYQVTQPVNLAHGGLTATFRLPLPSERLQPYLMGGAGAYAIYADAQANRGRRRFGGLDATYGGGIDFRISPRAGIRLDARSLVLTDYRRSRLNPQDGRLQNIQFPSAFPVAPAAKSTLNNFMFSLGFSYVPGGDDAPEGTP